jgi:hypothetical protein
MISEFSEAGRESVISIAERLNTKRRRRRRLHRLRKNSNFVIPRADVARGICFFLAKLELG